MLATAQAEPFENLDSFLEQNLGKELLRFTTAGSVDDGKSTLIGMRFTKINLIPSRKAASTGPARTLISLC